MDADCIEKQRDQLLSRREKRWSMSSQRIEQIIAELMKPLSDPLRNFNMDLYGLLEEYLTEGAVRALDGDESAEPPNFVEAAMLLQQSANIWGRKVDYLYQHVLDVSESLHSATQESSINSSESEPAATPRASRRRAASGGGAAAGEFAHISLAGAAGAARREALPRPPPTLPRMYIELEPRVLGPHDAPLCDYAGEPIGLLADFQVAWRLHEGLLVDELESGTSSQESALRPICLVELQAAIQAAAPPLPPATPPPPPSPPPSPLRASTPLFAGTPPLSASTPLPPPATPAARAQSARRDRKRRLDDNDIELNGKIDIGEDLQMKLSKVQEFSIPPSWIKKVREERKNRILSARRRLRREKPKLSDEMVAFSREETAAAAAYLKSSGLWGVAADSDDDGFFEQSSVGESDTSRPEEGEAAWQARVLRRAVEARARGALDVRELGARVLAALPPPAPAPFAAVLRAAAHEPCDVSRLFLAALFLANEGKVEVIQGPVGSLNSFSLLAAGAGERGGAHGTEPLR